MENEIYLPERPCPPTQPIAWWGVDLDLMSVTDFFTITDAQKKLMKGGLLQRPYKTDDWTTTGEVVKDFKSSQTQFKSDKGLTFNYGFMLQSTSTTDYTWAGKTFGVLGSGKDSLPEFTKGFRYDAVTTAYQYMYVSIFPNKSVLNL